MKETRRIGGIFLCAVLLVGTRSTVAQAPAAKRPGPLADVIPLRAGSADTKVLPNLVRRVPQQFEPEAHNLIQLDGPINAGSRARLAQAGVAAPR